LRPQEIVGEIFRLVPIRKLHWERRSSRFGNERFFCKVKENKDFRGDVLEYVAQGNPQFDAEIAKKRRFRTGTSQLRATTQRYFLASGRKFNWIKHLATLVTEPGEISGLRFLIECSLSG
jgi:hypothetical protein